LPNTAFLGIVVAANAEQWLRRDDEEKQMGLVLGTDMSGQEMAEKIAATAAHKSHRLAAYQVDGRNPVNPAQFDGIMRYLSGCPDLPRTPTSEEEMARRSPVSTAQEARKRANFQDIPEGFYATPSATGHNDYDFWKVAIGKNDYRRAKRVIGGGSAQVPATVEIGKPQQIAALRAICLEGIEKSANLYADLESRCTDCGRQLTDEESRAARKGPVCRSK
jgi:Family of unknown function (DUF6011)